MGQSKDLDEDVFHIPAVQIGSAQGPVPKPGEPLEPKSEPAPQPPKPQPQPTPGSTSTKSNPSNKK